MTDDGDGARRRGRAPLRPRSRRRWAVAGGIAAAWLVLEIMTGSFLTATVVLVLLAGLGAAGLAGLRALGVTADHPWIRRMASRPWRDGQDVLNVAMRHLSDVFVVTPSGTLLAPNLVELQLHPDDLDSLCQRMELGVISASLTEVYQDRVAEHEARFATPARADVYVTASPAIPPGRYRLRQGDLSRAQGDGPGRPYEEAPELGYAGPRPVTPPGGAWHGPDPDLTVASGTITVMERSLPQVPALRLVTGSEVAQTRMSGARAGRGPVELMLPEEPTVSREHARFTFADGRWWITNQGRNGLTLNGAPVTGEQPLRDGDEIRWGARPDALRSRVEIG